MDSILTNRCLTPVSNHETFNLVGGSKSLTSAETRKNSDERSSISIPSPPLSPDQRSLDVERDHKIFDVVGRSNDQIVGDFEEPATKTQTEQLEEGKTDDAPKISSSVLLSNQTFPIKDLTNAKLTVNAWASINNGDSSFKENQLVFLDRYYNIIDTRKKRAPRRKYPTAQPRRRVFFSASESETPNERVRTRRVIRDNVKYSDYESEVEISRPSTPKRSTKRVSKPSTPQPQFYSDYESIPDYSPPLSTLPPNNTKALKAEWKGQPMNLSDDPLVGKLHPAEVTLASVLRLPCNVYLDSKRRLFSEKVSRFRLGLPFRRTDAQKACKIDVNKASRLFAAFEKVGWLDDYHFRKFLDM
ncbi:hypothetical protein LJB42_002786 [Komagataella kurtzmanii]|nr:hypothetical protein LJB42_002786 [Komagataella kurtzmanii]